MEKLANLLADLDEEGVRALVESELEAGTGALELFDACRQGMILVGERYECSEYFVSDLMLAAEIFKQVTALLEPKMAGATTEKKGVVVIGTVQGDIHDIGKDLTAGMLRAGGFEVHDLGVDVAPAAFVAKLQETNAPVLALSGLLTIAFDAMKATVAAVEAANLKPDVKIMIGGGPVTKEIQEYTGADGWGASAQAAVALATQWVEN